MLRVNSYSINNFKSQTTQQRSTAFNPAKLSIYYYNDTHGNSDQIAGIMESAKHFRKHNKDTVNFVLSAGDNVSGADAQKNGFIFDLMQNMMGVDVSAIGNHEIDAGSKGFHQAAKDKKIQFIATNIELDDDNPMKEFVRKSTIKEQNGVRYGFIGAMPIDFKTCTKKQVQEGIEVLDFEDTVEELQEEIDELRKQNIDKIILVSHVGYETDKKLAQNLDGVDIIIGGHSHSVVNGAKHGENIILSKSNEPVLIVQAGENGKYYGVLNAEFNQNGTLKSVNNSLVQSPLSKKSPVVEFIKTKNLGESPQIATISEIDPMAKNRRIAPSAWANLMADSMRNELNTDIALLNAANIRKVPQEGILTQRDVSESAPMKNNLLKTKITQKQLVEAIKASLQRTYSSQEGEPGLLLVSGLTYKFTDNGKLLEMNFVDKKGKKTPIDINNPSDNITYSAVYDSFVAQQGGEYPELFPQFPTQEFNFDKDKTAVDYISKMKNKNSLVIVDDKRIEIIKTSQSKPQSNSMRSFLNLTCPIGA
ncbi:MAG: bifunctional metallophosphatase/5'-nucleotidase [Candidatus Gastranaerophilales bacterium]|nr:bifunctional metallophosphatase/5'-nucleotidase [Candidatus Gastranaerophilales bacterium]